MTMFSIIFYMTMFHVILLEDYDFYYILYDYVSCNLLEDYDFYNILYDYIT